MNLFVDTSVWSLALRRDSPSRTPQVRFLSRAIRGQAAIFSTGLVLQELLQGFKGPKARERIISTFAALPFITPDRGDHIAAADLRNGLRRKGVQVTTIDALLAALCIQHGLDMLTTDKDFTSMARYCDLSVLSF